MLATQSIATQPTYWPEAQSPARAGDFAPFLGGALTGQGSDISRLAGLIMALAAQVSGQGPAASAPAGQAGLAANPGGASYSQTELEAIAEKAAAKYGLAPELVKAVVSAESSWRTQAVSSAGAQGLMQLMPATAKELGVSDSFDPKQNIEGGSKYLSRLMTKYDGDVKKALSAYNWGPGNLAKGGPLPRETRNYLAKVTGLMADKTA